MDMLGLLAFAGAYALAVASPGPGIAAVIARGLGHGTAGAVPFVAGFVVGDLVWFALAALGLSAIAHLYAPLFLVIKYLGALYLLYLGWKLWTAKPQAVSETAAPVRAEGWRLFLGSLALTLGNPKVMMFFLAVLPTVVDLETLTPLAMAEIAGLIVVLLSLVLGGYVLLAVRARRLLRSPRAIGALNKASGAAMAAAAVAIATRP
jgi:threonine/homoserine/homoserine lactone efflux protein